VQEAAGAGDVAFDAVSEGFQGAWLGLEVAAAAVGQRCIVDGRCCEGCRVIGHIEAGAFPLG
jgi:hypothetical protein